MVVQKVQMTGDLHTETIFVFRDVEKTQNNVFQCSGIVMAK